MAVTIRSEIFGRYEGAPIRPGGVDLPDTVGPSKDPGRMSGERQG